MNREQAFGIGMEALDLAQDLSGHALLRDPQYINPKLTNEELVDELKTSHKAFVKATKQAYDLCNKISDWANEYPLEEDKK
jgi:hypothetical protein